MTCVDPDHFGITADGAIYPQPWTQWRPVATKTLPTVFKNYSVSDGGAKNEVLQTITLSWVNYSPLTQQVYGTITRGGAQVTLQARSRAYFLQRHAWALNDAALVLADVSQMGVGADAGAGGFLDTGTDLCVAGHHEHSLTNLFMPHVAGWPTLVPGAKITAKFELRFKSERWEDTTPSTTDGTTSNIRSGATRMDLFALPVL
jgi:hypothetical protein